jgi:hypothetical protein
MSDYIRREDALRIIRDGWSNHYSRKDMCDEINELPTLDEKEIIRKPFERVVERLENALASANRELKRTIEKNPMQTDYALGYHRATEKALSFVKEECGINERD